MVFFFQKMSHSAQKCERRDPLGTSGFVDFLEKVNKTGTSKVGAISKAQKAQNTFLKKNLTFLVFFLQKMSHSAGKNPKGDPLGTSGFVGFLEKVNKTGTSNVGAISKAQKAQNTF